MGESEGMEVCAKPSLAVLGRAWPCLAVPGHALPLVQASQATQASIEDRAQPDCTP